MTDIDRRKVLDLFKSEQTRDQSISSGVSFAEQASKDDLYFGCKYQENCSESMFLFDISLDRDRDSCSTLVSDLMSQRNLSQVNFSGDVTCCDRQKQKSHFAKQVVSAKNPSILKSDADRKDIRQSVKVITEELSHSPPDLRAAELTATVVSEKNLLTENVLPQDQLCQKSIQE